MTEEEWDMDQSAVEVTRRLIEEGSKWNETLVDLNRWVVLNAGMLIAVFYVVYAVNLAGLLQSYGIGRLIAFIVLTPFAINGPFLLRGGYRRYTKNVIRRDTWRKRFDILRKKEEELDELLSGEEGN